MTRMAASVAVEDGRLLFDGVDVAALGGRVDTPFFLYSQARIAANVAAVRRAFEARHAASRVFFAGKACSNLWFLEQVRAAGAGIEVNSGGELWKALRAGFSPDQAVFNGVAKSRAELAEAVSAGIAGVVADSLCELRRLDEVARDLGRPARVLPRVDVNVTGGTHPGLETASGGKAGIDLGEAMEALRLAAASEHLELAGLHLHIGSQITAVEPYLRALGVALDLLDDVERELGVTLPALDLGGGFAVAYRERSMRPDGDYFFTGLTVSDYAAAICAEVARRRPALELWLEPGRSIAADTAILVTRVESEKTKRLRDQLGPGRGGGSLAAGGRRLQHVLRPGALRLVLPAGLGDPAGRAGRTGASASPARSATAATSTAATTTRPTAACRRRRLPATCSRSTTPAPTRSSS